MGNLARNRTIYLLMAPGLLYFIILEYWPMYGVIIAFKKFSIGKGIMGSPWVGLKYFTMFFGGYDAWRIIRNTFLISFYTLVWGFPAPILFALFLNELKNLRFKRFTQTVSYLPHFISTVVIAGMVIEFLNPQSGLINRFINDVFGLEKVPFLFEPKWFRTIYVSMSVWRSFGWGAIIYLAALTRIDPELYASATIDGANRFQRVRYITIPGITPVIIILLILRLGRILDTGFEAILLLYQPVTYEVADVIDTYVYRRGLLDLNYSLGAAVGLFKGVVALVLVVASNSFARKVSDVSLW